MEVRESEAVGVVDDDGVGVGDVDAVLHDGRGEEHVVIIIHKADEDFLKLFRIHLTVTDGHSCVRDILMDERGYLGKVGYAVVHEVDLSVTRHLALHQMRGRVGRSNRKAFCYLLAPPKSVLTPEARRRLEALENFSELGSGFNLAMQDLDIRGAGNLLGAEQSGFMEDLGYETYQKILNQAVTELKNEEFQDIYAEEIAQGKEISGDEFVEDCALESDLEMYFPETYVPGSAERMFLYRELDNISDDDQLDAYRKRLEDRFGKMPKEGEQLLLVVPLRRIGKKLGCEKVILKQGRMQMQFVSNPESAYYKSQAFGRALNYISSHTRRCNLKEARGHRFMIVTGITSVGDALEVLKEIDNM